MILRLSSLLSFFMIWLAACAQPLSSGPILPVTDTLTYSLGESTVRMTLRTYGAPSPLFFIHLHDSESTAEKAAISLLEQYGGQLLSIDNNEQRNIGFRMRGQAFLFDPNRMFSDSGILATLKNLSKADSNAQKAVSGFAQFILDKIPDSVLVIAVHNNTEDRLSVHSYQTAPLDIEAAAVAVNADADADDFVLTTDSTLFAYYKNEKANAILQRSGLLPDDGSLSIFFGKRNRRYINIEAQHGHELQQILLLQKLFDFYGFQKKVFIESK